MSRIKLFSSIAATFAVVFVAVAAFAAQGNGISSSPLFKQNGDPFTPGGYVCDVECQERGLGDFEITSQLATFTPTVSLGLAGSLTGSVTITPNTGGSLDVEISLPSNVTVDGETYERDRDLTLDGVVDAWPVGTNEYTLRERVNFSNGTKLLYLKAGSTLTLTVQ